MNEIHEYVSFQVVKDGSLYCINLANISRFVSKEDVKVFFEKSNPKYNGITMIKDKIYNIINTEKAFEIKNFNWETSIIMNLGEREIVIPVYSINEIIKTNQINQISSNNKRINFIVRYDEKIHVLIENYFFD